jgi:hypothetical protein
MSEGAPLLERDDALALWNWAWAELDGPYDRVRTTRSRAEIVEGLLDILTFAACELTLAGHHEWVARLPEMLKLHRNWLMDEASPERRCLESLGQLLQRGAPISKAVRAMASDRDSNVRAILAHGLRLDDPDARALLQTLTSDPDRRVRNLARQRLPDDQPSAWWVGKFDADPIPRLETVDDDVLAALRTVALFVDRDTAAQTTMLAKFHEALPLVPTAILIEVARRFVAFDWLAPGYALMLDELLRRPRGALGLWDMLLARLGKPHDSIHLELMLTELCRSLPTERQGPLCQGLLEALVEHRQSPRIAAMAQLVSGVLNRLWPSSLPGGLLLDAWESLTATAPELGKGLISLMADERVDLTRDLARLLPLAERDDSLGKVVSVTVARLEPIARRAFVTRGLGSEHHHIRVCALQQLVGLPPDPPGSSAAAFARYWAEPALRRVIASDERLCQAFCPYLRRHLRAGALSVSEAAATLGAIGALWGGTAAADAQAWRAARLERVMAWHGDAGEIGPPTEREWEAWRELRRQVLEDRPRVMGIELLRERPAGALHGDDRFVIDWLVDRWRRDWGSVTGAAERRNGYVGATMAVLFALVGVLDPYVIERLEQVLGQVREVDRDLAGMLEEEIGKLREGLLSDPRAGSS